MPTTTTIDRFGRVVIPKEKRDQFGLVPGAVVTMVDSGEGLLLELGTPAVPLTLKGGILVYSGEVAADAGALLRGLREERIQRFFPGRSR